MNKTTDRNIKKQTQLKHTKEKLHQLKDTKSRKKLNLVKSLKNLMKRNERKGLEYGRRRGSKTKTKTETSLCR